VARAEIGDGYHGLYPVEAEYAAGYGERLNRAHAALVANGFIPVAAGVAPEAPPAPGFDTMQVTVAMTDWDNSKQAACRIDAIARAFPLALLYYELPHGEYFRSRRLFAGEAERDEWGSLVEVCIRATTSLRLCCL
jgi:hypothetical protein